MKVTEPDDSLRYASFYQVALQQAAAGAGPLMARLIAHTRAQLRTREDQSTDRRTRDDLTHSRRLLNQFESALCERFTEELLAAFTRVGVVERRSPALHFDQLASMDDARLRESVEGERQHQQVQHAVGPALAELNRVVCGILGLADAPVERNPLRPAIYLEAVTAALAHLQVPAVVRRSWTSIACSALGQELALSYHTLATELRERAGAVAPPVTGSNIVPPAVVPRDGAAVPDPSLLTLYKLRHLLADGGGPESAALGLRYETPVEGAAPDSDFGAGEPVATGFRPTVPAAFDAARDWKQLDQVVQRVEQRKSGGGSGSADRLQQLRAQMHGAAHGMEQALALEVVALMVENITHDRRLLAPVQDLVAALEPALLRLAMVDPRFFSHKQHPARRLLHEITHRSIAFESVDSRGFSGFMEPLREAVEPLADGAAIDNAEPFDQVLGRLVASWDDPAGRDQRQLAKAVKALKKAERRNALAATTAMDVLARPDAALVPDAVLDFLCGPWAQVVAHARMEDRTGASDPGHFAALIDDLMWSAQPHLTRRNVLALTRVVPRLLSRLRGGLASIDYPPRKTGEFFELLMHLHQRGFKGDADAVASGAPVATRPATLTSRGAGPDATWVAPLEAQASGFIDLSTDLGAAPAPAVALPPSGLAGLVEGAWVTLQAEGTWTRTQLTWTSPNATLLLFTDALGHMQSLTRRACEQLLAGGKMRLLSTDPVEDALDAVAQAALRNSVDVHL